MKVARRPGSHSRMSFALLFATFFAVSLVRVRNCVRAWKIVGFQSVGGPTISSP